MTAQVLANVLMQRATARAMSQPDPREYWYRVVSELECLLPQAQHDDEDRLVEQLLEFGARLGLLTFSSTEIN